MSLNSCQKDRTNVDLDSISKSTWRLIYLEEIKVNKDLYPEGLPFIKFTRDSKITISTGCNMFESNILIEGSDIKISSGLLHGISCSESKKEVESTMMQGLFHSNKLFQEGNTLIFMQDDKLLLRFKK
jgi:heat shock protein HslJ